MPGGDKVTVEAVNLLDTGVWRCTVVGPDAGRILALDDAKQYLIKPEGQEMRPRARWQLGFPGGALAVCIAWKD